mmetsp:Transcript_108235/g.186913  ORF Transcript_108235/g.186913 Transcript_108235/m.186913 type:complete len:379 (-) Transcript_108235:1078-2214(-)
MYHPYHAGYYPYDARYYPYPAWIYLRHARCHPDIVRHPLEHDRHHPTMLGTTPSMVGTTPAMLGIAPTTLGTVLDIEAGGPMGVRRGPRRLDDTRVREVPLGDGEDSAVVFAVEGVVHVRARAAGVAEVTSLGHAVLVAGGGVRDLVAGLRQAVPPVPAIDVAVLALQHELGRAAVVGQQDVADLDEQGPVERQVRCQREAEVIAFHGHCMVHQDWLGSGCQADIADAGAGDISLGAASYDESLGQRQVQRVAVERVGGLVEGHEGQGALRGALPGPQAGAEAGGGGRGEGGGEVGGGPGADHPLPSVPVHAVRRPLRHDGPCRGLGPGSGWPGRVLGRPAQELDPGGGNPRDFSDKGDGLVQNGAGGGVHDDLHEVR